MAVSTGVLSLHAHVYNMTGVSGFNPANGTDLGTLGDMTLAEFERDVSIYRGLEYGSTPKLASIDGSGCILKFALEEYDAASIAVIAQRIQPAGTTINYNGALAASYALGNTLGSSQLLKLLVADSVQPSTRPMLLIPKAVVVRVESLALSMASRMMTPAAITVIGLHDSTLGGPFAFGDSQYFTEA